MQHPVGSGWACLDSDATAACEQQGLRRAAAGGAGGRIRADERQVGAARVCRPRAAGPQPPQPRRSARRRDRRRDRPEAQRDYSAFDALRVPRSAYRRRRRHRPIFHRLLQGPGPAPRAHGGHVRHQRPSARPPHRLQQPCIRLFLLRPGGGSARLAVNPSIRKRQFL